MTKTLVVVALVLLPARWADARASGIGFQARLDDPPRVVSAYDENPDQFSAAIYPLTTAVLARELLFNPKLDYGSHYYSSLTFKTRYHRDLDLIPVSVDAGAFMLRRLEAKIAERETFLARNSLSESQKGDGRVGLNIGVGLPKRFDRMFGEGGANLRVSGYRRITMSGRSQWNDETGSGVRQQSKFPSLNMEQISRFDIQGTIGTKISVSVSQDNQNDNIPLANRLLLRYKGDEDDILKTIEAGNTNLSLPNTRFVGYSQRIQGLFGLKSEAQLGNLNLTIIASQEKGSSESAVISATGEENADYIRDYSYVQGRIFDLFYPEEASRILGPRDQIKVWVYQEEKRLDNAEALGRQLVNPSGLRPDSIRMIEADPSSWELLFNQDTAFSPVALVFYTTQRRAIGVYIEITRFDDETDSSWVEKIGNREAQTDTLKYIYKYNATPDHPTWDLMWRNCYRVPKNLNYEDVEINVFKGLKNQEGRTSNLDYQQVAGVSQDPYIQILGLDQWNNNRTGVKVPDGKMDNREEVYRAEWGLIVFPDREPFNSKRTFTDQNGQQSDVLALPVELLYRYNGSDNLSASEYYLQLTTKARSSTIRLGRANIIESSERVTLNGQLLTKGVDYNIQYDFGQVTLLTDEALDPNADVQIEFQYAPFAALQKKTLMGARAEYDYSDDLKFGTTVLFKSDKAQDRKPRIGQETAKALLLDFDVSFALHPGFLTKMVDALPLVSSEAASRLIVSAEVAQSRPNPNIEGEAFLDDFESATETLSLGIIRTDWTLASPPRFGTTDDSTLKHEDRGVMRWHNPPPIPRSEVYLGEVRAGEGSLQPLRLIYRPYGNVCRGEELPDSSWGGMMRHFGSRVDANRVRLFEVRAKGGKGILHFDFGRISEDINGNDRPETEDWSGGLVRNNSLDVGNGINEDVGLDSLRDEEEVSYCVVWNDNDWGDTVYHADYNPDPAGDNWWFEGFGQGTGSNNSRPPVPVSLWNSTFQIEGSSQNFAQNVNSVEHYLHYDWQNGTDGNIDDDAVRGIPDDEALSASYEDDDAYFSFEMPLNADPTNRFWVEGSEFNGWSTYQIPIRDSSVARIVVEDESFEVVWSEISHVRVWFEFIDTAGLDIQSADSLNLDSLKYTNLDSVLIADWGFIQTNWHDSLVPASGSDVTSEFHISSVSEADSTFVAPSWVEPWEDRVNNVTETQKGLGLLFTHLQPGQNPGEQGAQGIATKDLLTAESYTGYRRLEMWVYGDKDPEEPGGPDELLVADDSLMFFFRIGRDSLNFYEYRSYLEEGWADGNHVNMDFNVITGLKDIAERNLGSGSNLVADSSGPYRVIGRPTIDGVEFMAAGVVNRGSQPISGRVWIDELRVTEVRKDVGNAGRVSVSGSAADLITYNFNYEFRDPYFRGLSQATRGGSRNNLGSGKENTSLSYGGTLNLHKFLPRSWGMQLPVTASYKESRQIPLLRTNSDVVLTPEVREEEAVLSRSVNFSTREKFIRKTPNLLFSALLNRQQISFSYARSHRQNVANPLMFSETYNVLPKFDMGIRKEVELPLFFWTKPIPVLNKLGDSKLSLFPSKWNWSGKFTRSLNFKEDTDEHRTGSYSRTLDGTMNLSHKPFKTLSIDYGFTTKRDLTDPDLVRLVFNDMKVGLEKNYNQNFRTSYDPKLVKFLTSSFSYSANYTDNHNPTDSSRTTSLSRNWGVSGNFRHQDILGKGKKKNTGGRNRRRGTVRGGVTSEDRKEADKGGKFYDPLFTGLRFLTGWLQPVSYKYSRSFTRSVPGLRVKADWRYRLGLNPMQDLDTIGTSRKPSSGESQAYDFASGFNLLGGITTTVAYRTQIARDIVRIGRDLNETTTTSWPDVTLRIQKFKTLPLLKPYVNWFIGVFSPRTAYSRQLKEAVNMERGIRFNQVETIGRNPVIALTFKLFRALSLSGSYTWSETIDEKANSSTGEPQTLTISTKRSVAGSSKFAFSLPGGLSIPLLGKLRFKSQVSIDLTVKYSSSFSETSAKGGPFAVGANSSNFAVSPVLSYSFSQKIRGGLTARWQDNNDVKFNRKSHVREVQIWTEIRF